MGKKLTRLVFLWVGIILPLLLIGIVILQGKKKKHYPKPLSEKPFVVVIPSYNNAKYCEQNLLSVLGQEYGHFRVIYVDDASTDGTGDKVQAFIEHSSLKDRVTLIRRDRNVGSLQNLYEIIQTCDDQEVVVRVDGNDFLAHPFVLKRLNQVYADESVWMTYGNYLDYPSYQQNSKLCATFPAQALQARRFRQHRWISTHPHTFYAGLFKKIAAQHLMKEGKFLPMAGDIAILIPMLEMSGKHTHYIDEVLYLYNRINPLNDHKKDLNLQSACEAYVRSLPIYPLLEQPPYVHPEAAR